jgi:hypothetical protein
MVWGGTGFIAFVFYFNTSCQGEFDQGICWINISFPQLSCLWGYYLFWVICMYVYQVWAAGFAYICLRQGLPATFEIRNQCATETFRCLWVYAIYLSIIMLFFMIISADPTAAPGTSMNNFAKFLLFVIANKGSVDGIVWFLLHDFARDMVLAVDQAASTENPSNDTESPSSSDVAFCEGHTAGADGPDAPSSKLQHIDCCKSWAGRTKHGD